MKTVFSLISSESKHICNQNRGDRVASYIVVKDDKELEINVLKPDDWSIGDMRPCILFYFGGGFVKRNLKHFQCQAEYFRELGAVCILSDYRLASEGSGLETCLEDAEEVLNEVYARSEELGIDKHKIIVSGGSAGGALACWCSMNTNIPCAQILFNPVLYFGEKNIQIISQQDIHIQINDEVVAASKLNNYQQYWGQEYRKHPEQFSAYHMLDEQVIPPTLILQGTYDPIAYQGVILFHQKAIEKKQECYTVLYQGEPHGFFNYDKIENKFCYYDTLHQMEKFLRERKLI